MTLLRRLDNSVIKPNIDADVVLSEVFQQHDESSDLGEVVSIEGLTAILLDSLSKEKYFTKYKRSEIRI